MTLLELQDVTYRYKNTAEAVYIRSSIILNPENFIAYWGVWSREIHSIVPSCWLR